MKKIRRLIIKVIRKSLGFVRIFNGKIYQKLYFRWMRLAGIMIEQEQVYISPNVYFDSENYSLIKIGASVIISNNVTILVHDYSIQVALKKYEKEQKNCLYSSVELSDNCFIGINSTLLPGASVGANTIIGAGSVVKSKMPDNTVCAGNPCKVICTLEEYYFKHKDDLPKGN